MTDPERRVLAASRARDLCLSLRRAFVGATALDTLRAGGAMALRRDELEVALGLAWAAGDVGLIRTALAALPPDRIERDAVLSTFRAAAARASAGAGGTTGPISG